MCAVTPDEKSRIIEIVQSMVCEPGIVAPDKCGLTMRGFVQYIARDHADTWSRITDVLGERHSDLQVRHVAIVTNLLKEGFDNPRSGDGYVLRERIDPQRALRPEVIELFMAAA